MTQTKKLTADTPPLPLPHTPSNSPSREHFPKDVIAGEAKPLVGSSQLPGRVTHPARPDQGAPALGQELRVTLSEAHTYLDQVRAQFIDQPDIYRTFLDILIDFKSQVIDIPGIVSPMTLMPATGHPVTKKELTPISHINPPKMPATPPNTATESSEPVAPSVIHEIGVSTSMLSEQLGIGTKMGPSQPPGGLAHPAYLAPGALASQGYQIEYGASNDPNTIHLRH
ncbi:hypothetical protein ACJ73_08158 [Blastomyces percursus]|uniref:Paired amphipathic helix protein Sin3a n=1 Tax=Blastomyces percursus TaxID=1658174 RepID=A0A1J9PVX6_9EURO|nr:hypothetical protein ACJ73_08158 [Blastomyces percursus]